ncbi:succinate dehydrogenase/fumarate reductase iron-sulfur subunit [Synechocystis sp. LEGE 06083]|uniref:succinate dehydrogenase/fumarate reductase iron-sulfur subunit n=1 Tax=Synechocystis sp. LEGE 06083 TaxID=915336 RepID=UPI00187EA0EC|nr:succinate dehydrogenase/fumarate reductase iron-sulfur subunit [Synechocystis sp. LEGE 06083]MBE9197127.1 succinate dehydrogenase/fumarate reductase iron-sulfur subunit [Synechocystis sp. LEGE 06083]
MQVQFQILRQKPQQSPYLEKFDLEVEPGTTILECLNRIKWEQDGSLNFRKNCRNTICGSCSMRVNGRSALACKENVGSETQLFTQINEAGIPVVTVAPLGNLPVIKDLIVDMQPFWDDLQRVEPYVSTQGRKVPEREFLQTPAEREKLNQMGNCILCGACYSECNAKSVNPDFVGPHALAKAQRLLADSRDGATADRLENYNNATAGAWGCTRCYLCNEVCPMEVAPMDQIGKIKSALLAKKTAQDSRPVRHRKVMVDLVKAGGWVDERKFGIYVVGNFFRDLKGIASILPLGLRMIGSGKFPLAFEPSAGTKEVRGLIEQVQEAEKIGNR